VLPGNEPTLEEPIPGGRRRRLRLVG
jgi:hypothetical protein